jgi:hypothetical protein
MATGRRFSRAVTAEDDRHKLDRRLAGWGMLPQVQAARDQAAAEAWEQARQAERNRLQTQRERQQREDDRARLARLESQYAASRRVAVAAAQQQRHEAFWQERSRALDELVAMTMPPRPGVEPAQSVEPYDQGSGQLGFSDFDPALMADPARWW